MKSEACLAADNIMRRVNKHVSGKDGLVKTIFSVILATCQVEVLAAPNEDCLAEAPPLSQACNLTGLSGHQLRKAMV